MTKFTGRQTALFIDGNEIGGVLSTSRSANKERLEVTAFQDTAKTYIAGLLDGSVTVDFYIDTDVAFNQSFLASAEGTNVTLVLGFNGTAAAPMISGLVYIDEVSFDFGVSDPVTGSISCTGHTTYQIS